MIPSDLRHIINNTPWQRMRTARGSADSIPPLLAQLFSNSNAEKTRAASDLDDLLCHQHVMISEAAVPAVPILIAALRQAKEPEIIESLLFVFEGFGAAISARDWNHGEPPDFLDNLRQLMTESRALFESFLGIKDMEVGEAAKIILDHIDTPIRRHGRSNQEEI